MAKLRKFRILRVLCVVAVAAVGFMAVEALTSGITPTAQALCMAGTWCGPDDPPVYCSNHHTYGNICVANAACQYSCCVLGSKGCSGDPD